MNNHIRRISNGTPFYNKCILNDEREKLTRLEHRRSYNGQTQVIMIALVSVDY